jgi:AcrR family transcriptional regulator
VEKRARTARQRARDEVTAEILMAARARLQEAGPGELSVRAVARDVGMASSAVYRYFPGRNELLTALLVTAYDELGHHAEAADETVNDRGDAIGRWLVTCRAVRDWAVSHPHDYALLYGSPVPGYAAPQDTERPATRVIVRLIEIISSAGRSGAAAPVRTPPGGAKDPTPYVTDALAFVRDRGLVDPEPELVLRTLMAWSTLFGALSFELFGHLRGSVGDFEGFHEQVALRLAADLGLGSR